jgi:hypothetical protein
MLGVLMNRRYKSHLDRPSSTLFFFDTDTSLSSPWMFLLYPTSSYHTRPLFLPWLFFLTKYDTTTCFAPHLCIDSSFCFFPLSGLKNGIFKTWTSMLAFNSPCIPVSLRVTFFSSFLFFFFSFYLSHLVLSWSFSLFIPSDGRSERCCGGKGRVWNFFFSFFYFFETLAKLHSAEFSKGCCVLYNIMDCTGCSFCLLPSLDRF